MERVARLTCAKCRTPFLWIRKRNVGTAWLFDKCKLLGIDLFEGEEEMICSRCGTAITIPLDALEGLAKARGIDVDPDSEIDLRRI